MTTVQVQKKPYNSFGSEDDIKRARIQVERASDGWAELKVIASKIILNTLDGVVNGEGKDFLTDNGVNNSFTTTDGKTVVVEKGRIKSIT